MLRVGLTGGIGAGKTTISEKFHAFYNIPVLDADEITRKLMRPGKQAFKEIVKLFGDEVISQNGELDRSYLRAIVFSDPARRRQLEEILHPKVRAELTAQTEKLDCQYCLVVIPLLIESKMQATVDRILVINTLKQHQIERVKKRDQCSESHVKNILDAQINSQERLRHADDIISNNGTLQDLDAQIHRLHEKYLALSS